MPRGMRRAGRGAGPGPARGRGRRTVRRRRRRRVVVAGGLLAVGAHKLTSRDADRIEQHTGVQPEELSEEQLDQSMRELGIEDAKEEDQS